MKRKLLALLLSTSFLMLAVTGCGNSSSTESNDVVSEETENEEGENEEQIDQVRKRIARLKKKLAHD